MILPYDQEVGGYNNPFTDSQFNKAVTMFPSELGAQQGAEVLI